MCAGSSGVALGITGEQRSAASSKSQSEGRRHGKCGVTPAHPANASHRGGVTALGVTLTLAVRHHQRTFLPPVGNRTTRICESHRSESWEGQLWLVRRLLGELPSSFHLGSLGPLPHEAASASAASSLACASPQRSCNSRMLRSTSGIEPNHASRRPVSPAGAGRCCS
jgi:hypothetical protein